MQRAIGLANDLTSGFRSYRNEDEGGRRIWKKSKFPSERNKISIIVRNNYRWSGHAETIPSWIFPPHDLHIHERLYGISNDFRTISIHRGTISFNVPFNELFPSNLSPFQAATIRSWKRKKVTWEKKRKIKVEKWKNNARRSKISWTRDARGTDRATVAVKSSNSRGVHKNVYHLQ